MRSSAAAARWLGLGLGGGETLAVAGRLRLGELGGMLGQRHRRFGALADGEVVVEQEFGRRAHQ